MVEVELDLLDSLGWQIFEFLIHVAIIAVVCRNADNFVVNFAVVDKLHNAEDASFHPNAGGERLVGNHKNVKFVAILVEGLGDEAVVAGLRKGDRFDAVKHEASVLAIPFNFVI